MFLSTLFVCSLVILLLVCGFFVLALKLKNNGIADVAWGVGILLIAITSLLLNGGISARAFLVTLLTLIWGTRLSWHIYIRNNGKKEDFRYSDWRKKWGKKWVIKSFLYVFLFQGFLMILVSLPVSYTNSVEGSVIGFFDRLGVLVWVIGFYFEAVSDWQLHNFKKSASKVKVMKTGLWRYSRHPNYFGESLMWWGIYIIAVSNLGAMWTFIGPLFITYSLLKVSGVTLLERRYSENHEYKEYQKNTSAFIPWFPKI